MAVAEEGRGVVRMSLHQPIGIAELQKRRTTQVRKFRVLI